MHIFFSILWKIVRNETATIIPARVSQMRKPAQHHTSTGEHPAHPKHASATKRPYNTQHLALYGNTITPIHDYHSGLQFKLAPQGSEREKNPQESHSKQHQSRQGVTGWRKPVREAKPRHSKHETASDKKPCPPNGVREKKGGLLGSASTCTCYCRRPSMRTQSQKVAGCKLKHITTGQCVWRLPRCAMQLCCESTLTKASFVVVSQLLLTEEPPTDVDCEPNTWSAGWQGCTKDIDAKHLFQRCHLQAVPRSIFLHGPYGAWL